MKKKVFVSLLIGFLIILLAQIINGAINFLVFFSISPSELQDFYNSSIARGLDVIIDVISLFAFVIAGFVLGRRMGSKGWFYGGLVGFIWFALLLILTMLPLLLPNELVAMQQKRVIESLKFIPIRLAELLVLTGIGGWLGERSLKGKKLL